MLLNREGFVIAASLNDLFQRAAQTLRCKALGLVSGSVFAMTAVAATAFAPSLQAAEAAAAKLSLKSSSAIVIDQESGQTLFGKNPNAIVPIASITKVMTAVVVLDANLDQNEVLTVSNDDVDFLRGSHSRLHVGVSTTREEMLRLALMSSENRAASALSRYYPGGREAFVQAMNQKAAILGMSGTRYADSTGLSSTNVSTAEDLARLVRAAHQQYPKIREFSTTTSYMATINGREMGFRNTNALVSNPGWHIGLSKTGYINEAGRCLVMQATLAGRAVVIVLLDSWGKYTRTADAARIRNWLEVAAGYSSPTRQATTARKAAKVSARASTNHHATQKTAMRNKSVRRNVSVVSTGRRPV